MLLCLTPTPKIPGETCVYYHIAWSNPQGGAEHQVHVNQKMGVELALPAPKRTRLNQNQNIDSTVGDCDCDCVCVCECVSVSAFIYCPMAYLASALTSIVPVRRPNKSPATSINNNSTTTSRTAQGKRYGSWPLAGVELMRSSDWMDTGRPGRNSCGWVLSHTQESDALYYKNHPTNKHLESILMLATISNTQPS